MQSAGKKDVQGKTYNADAFLLDGHTARFLSRERKSDAEVRLEELQTLYDRRLITEEEYQEKRRDILDRL